MMASERKSIRLRWGAIVTAAILALLCLLWVYPFLWLLSASLKEPLELRMATSEVLEFFRRLLNFLGQLEIVQQLRVAVDRQAGRVA